jgi:hypothetical protein
VISWDASPGPPKAKAHFIDPPPTSMNPITESSIEGEWEGFDGDRVFDLVNGQQCQQDA